MKTTAATLLAVLAASGAMLASLPAEARDGHRERHEYRGWYDDHDHGRRHFKHKHKEHRGYRGERVVIKEKVVIRERPVYREYVSYYEPPVRRVYSRDPSIVIGVSIPPIIIPLR